MTADTPDATAQAIAGRLSPAQKTALLRCAECWDDGQGTDVARPMLDELTAFGLLQKVAPKEWEVTAVGCALLAAERDGGEVARG